MDLEVLQENFAKALSISSRFASTRAQLPVLENVLVTAEKTKVILSATNLENSVAISLGAKVKEDGNITVPAKTLFEIVSNLPLGNLSLTSDKEHLKISTTNFSSMVSGMNSSDFPKIPYSIIKSEALILPRNAILGALPQVIFAASIDESRPILTGVLFIFGKNELTLVATDGFRLSKKVIRLSGNIKEKKAVLPKNILLEISRIGEEEEEISLDLREKENQVVFGLGNAVVSSRILEGDYPEFEKIIPNSSALKIRTDKEELLRAVKLASVFARDTSNIVKVKIFKTSIKVFAESSQSGNQETTVDVAVEGDIPKDFEIAFNYKFLEDFLKVVTGDEVFVGLNDSSSPGVFTDPKDESMLHLIMPVKLQG